MTISPEQATKKEHYEYLIERIDEAQERTFHLEASWIAYAIAEDRLGAMLKQIGISPPRGIARKRLALEKELDHSAPLRQALQGSNLFSRTGEWTEERNKLVHAMAAEVESTDALNKRILKLSQEGRVIARELATVARRLKKRIPKID